MSAVPFQMLVFLASFLLFQLELVAGRRLMPEYGSSADVWTTSLMFFQAILFLGYLYSGRAPTALLGKRSVRVHLIVVLAPLLTFPFHFRSFDVSRIGAVLLSLSVSIGAAFFALATTSVAVQTWFSRTAHPRRGDPYFLYASSNAGALLALLTYPVVFEPLLAVSVQLHLWYTGYVVFALLQFYCLRLTFGNPMARAPGPLPSEEAAGRVEARSRPAHGGGSLPGGGSSEVASSHSRGSFARWLLLAAGANALLMAVTHNVTIDAPVPLLWILPLSVYLGTVVVCFGRRPPAHRTVLGAGLAGLLFSLGAFAMIVYGKHMQQAVIGVHVSILFVVCLQVHFRLARSKPRDPARLGRFYLAISAGGWLGAVLVAFVTPVLFARVAHPAVDYGVAALVLTLAYERLPRALAPGGSRPVRAAVLAIAVCMMPVVAITWMIESPILLMGDVYRFRTFYGTYRVRDHEGFRWFHHGNTVHGVQRLDAGAAPEPLGYFHRGSPIGRLLDGDLRFEQVGIVGLGIGSLTAYQRPRQSWTYFEIDGEVERVARRYFDHLDAAVAPTRVVIGDARVTLEGEPDGIFDLLVLDVFSSDFVPLHLVTREAVALYTRKSSSSGLVVFHISSRLLDIVPVLERVATELELRWAVDDRNEGIDDIARFSSRWFAVSHDPLRIESLKRLGWREEELPAEVRVRRVWTDDYVNLFHAF